MSEDKNRPQTCGQCKHWDRENALLTRAGGERELRFAPCLWLEGKGIRDTSRSEKGTPLQDCQAEPLIK